MNRSSWRLAATLASACLVVAGASTAPAWADPGDPHAVGGQNQELANTALINPEATVRLSIHKYLGVPTDTAHNGTEVSVDQPGLDGVDFDVYRVYTDADHTTAVDLLTNAGWEAASAIHDHQPTAREIADGAFVINGVTYYIAKEATVTTSDGGSAVFTKENGVGLYLVAENLVSSGALTSGGETVDKGAITPSAPFFVTLPMTEPGGAGRWMYDVNVYPKNQKETASKTVRDDGADAGVTDNNQMTYEIVSSITAGLTGEQMGTYQVNDRLDARLAWVSTTVSLGDTALVENTHYTLAHEQQSDGTTLVTVTFTPEGLTALADAKAADPAAQVTTVVVAELREPGSDGVIPNRATVIPNTGWVDSNPGKPGIPTDEVTSYFGDIAITKVDPADSAASLAGAEFAVFTDADANGTCETGELAGEPLTTAVVGQDNTASFTGLQASNWYDGEEQDVPHGYCVVETKAPEGYNLSAEPYYVTIDYTTAVRGETPATVAVEVPNEKINLGNSLPLTGGRGTGAISAAGVLLLLGGAGYYVVAHRRKA